MAKLLNINSICDCLQQLLSYNLKSISEENILKKDILLTIISKLEIDDYEVNLKLKQASQNICDFLSEILQSRKFILFFIDFPDLAKVFYSMLFIQIKYSSGKNLLKVFCKLNQALLKEIKGGATLIKNNTILYIPTMFMNFQNEEENITSPFELQDHSKLEHLFLLQSKSIEIVIQDFVTSISNEIEVKRTLDSECLNTKSLGLKKSNINYNRVYDIEYLSSLYEVILNLISKDNYHKVFSEGINLLTRQLSSNIFFKTAIVI